MLARIVGLFVVLLALLAGGCSSSKSVATVNGTEISAADFESALITLDGQGVKTLNWLISYQLLMDACADKKITITAEQAEARMAENLKRAGQSAANWRREAINAGRDPEAMLREAKFEIALHKLLTEGIKVSEQELKQAYEANQEGFRVLQLARIVLKDEKEAKEVSRRLSEGARFAELASEHSLDTPNVRENGGVMGPPQPVGGWDNHYLQAVQNLPVGTASAPFKHGHQGQEVWEIVRVVKQDLLKFEDVKNTMRETVEREQAMASGRSHQRLIGELMAKANVTIKHPTLMSLEQQYGNPLPDAFGGGKSPGKSDAPAAPPAQPPSSGSGKGG